MRKIYHQLFSLFPPWRDTALGKEGRRRTFEVGGMGYCCAWARCSSPLHCPLGVVRAQYCWTRVTSSPSPCFPRYPSTDQQELMGGWTGGVSGTSIIQVGIQTTNLLIRSYAGKLLTERTWKIDRTEEGRRRSSEVWREGILRPDVIVAGRNRECKKGGGEMRAIWHWG